MPKDKSVGAALFLTFLFGPLGLLYVSFGAALVMIAIALFVAFVTLGFGLILVWPTTMILAAVLASNKHSRHQAWVAGRPTQKSIPVPIQHSLGTPPPMPAAPVAAAPAVATAQPAAKRPEIMWLRAGDRYLHGYSITDPYYGIWDREAAGPPVQRYPYTEHGKSEAEARFRELEPNAVEGGPNTRPSP